MIIEITDPGAPELELFVRPGKDLFVAESIPVIEAALSAGCVPLAYLAERARAAWLCGTAEEPASEAKCAKTENPASEAKCDTAEDPASEAKCGAGEDPESKAGRGMAGSVPIYTADRALLQGLTGFPLTRGVLCAMKRPPALSVAQVCGGQRVVYLERVCDPSNVGAIFRCAAALGFEGIVLSPGCADPLYRKAVRASMGCVFRIPWCVGTLREISALGFATAALALTEDSVPPETLAAMRLPRLALALGNEGEGLRPQTIAACDHVMKIPMAPGVDSLNVVTAAAIAFYTQAQGA